MKSGVSGSITQLSSQSSVLDAEWYEIALTVDSGNLSQLYLDGQLEDSDSQAITSIGNDSNFLIGVANSNGNKLLAGELMDLRLFNYALSSEEAQLRLSPSGGNVDENAAPGTLAGTIQFPAIGESPVTELVSGPGDTGNSSFILKNRQLSLLQSLDYEQASELPIRIRTTLANGYFVENIAIVSVNNLYAPIVTTSNAETGDVLVGSIGNNGGSTVLNAGFYLSSSPWFRASDTETLHATTLSEGIFKTMAPDL